MIPNVAKSSTMETVSLGLKKNAFICDFTFFTAFIMYLNTGWS